MSRSDDPDNFFQTTDSITERERKAAKSVANKNGSPIRLPSKILAVIADPASADRIFVAEAAGTARRIELDTLSTRHTFTGPTSPLPTLALSTSRPHTLYAGSWDRSIWSWDVQSRRPGRRFIGHSDFVKCLIYAHFQPPVGSEACINVLISGAADATVAIWDADTGAKLHVLRGHGMGVLALALDPAGWDARGWGALRVAGGEKGGDGAVTLFSASTDRAILRWQLAVMPSVASSVAPSEDTSTEFALPSLTIHAAPLSSAPATALPPLTPHATSITNLLFTPLTSDEPDLLTSSLDGHVKLLSRHNKWGEGDSFDCGTKNGVRALAASSDGRYVVSGGRDEDVWVWDTNGDAGEEDREEGDGKVVCKWVGHADEVMGLLVREDGVVISVGLDATVRRWRLGNWELREDVGEAVKASIDAEEIVEGEGATKTELTAEEEAELADLMDD